MPGRDIQRNDLSRLWLLDGRAGPSNVPTYETRAIAGGANFPGGTPTKIENPDPASYGKFVTAGLIPGEEGEPTMEVTARFDPDNASKFLALLRGGCNADLQVHIGECHDPQDFNGGWSKVAVLEEARPTSYGTDTLGSLQSSDRAVVNETVPFQGTDYYEILRLIFAEQAGALIELEIIAVEICDARTCGECGIATSGCDHILATAIAGSASPGILAQVIFSSDGGLTYGETFPTTLAATEDPSDATCVSPNYVIISNDSCSLHYASVADILAGTEIWTEVTTGFVAAIGCPNAIFSVNSRVTWIVGDGGHIYFTADPTSGVTVQADGTVTSENLNAIHAASDDDALAVGDNNALVRTSNGGEIWEAITGPAPAVVLNTCWMVNDQQWWVGTAGGQLFYTLNGGTDWVEKVFPGSGAGEVRDIAFTNGTIGYIAHDTAVPLGRLLRTIDGGQSWYVLPEGQGSMPVNDRFNAIATCEKPNENVVFAGGLADGGTDGILVKGAG